MNVHFWRIKALVEKYKTLKTKVQLGEMNYLSLGIYFMYLIFCQTIME